MMNDSVELRLIGITYNQIESGVYALVLEDLVQKRRLAIVIGYPEAQSIECRLQNVKTPRPLAHDLLANMLNSLDARLLRVDIHRLPGGPYAGKLTIMDCMGEIKEIDARSSDAIALAIRTNSPIFTTRALLDKEGYSLGNKTQGENNKETAKHQSKPYSSLYTVEQLQQLLERYVAEENYEEAAKIKTELEKRKTQGRNESQEL